MKIPTVKMTVPVFKEREYAPNSVSVNPEQEIDVRMELTEVSLEYASFLINYGEDFENHASGGVRYYIFPRTEYIDELFEAFVESGFGKTLLESLTCEILFGVKLFSDEAAERMIRSALHQMLDNAIENDNSTVRDWI